MRESAFSEEQLERWSACLAQQVGLYFPRERWGALERGLQGAARECAGADTPAWLARLVSGPLVRSEIEVLARHLTVGETYFFREKAAFEILEREILPELIRSRRATTRQLRFWSAGCATGEEAYSLAILLGEMLAGAADWKLTLLATDINPQSLEKALQGVYSDWSFRDVPARIRETYFRKQGRRWTILPELKRAALFSYLNLAEDAYPSLGTNTNAMDVIVCRNVLMYFAPEQARKVIAKFHRCLVEGGWLIVSPCEASASLFSEFTAVHYPGAVFYRKRAAREVPEPAEPSSLMVPSAAPPFFDFALPAERPEISSAAPASLAALEAETPAGEAAEALPPEAPPRAYETAQALYEKGCYAQAAETLEADEDESAQTPEAKALVARAYANQGKLAEALARCEGAIERDKLQPEYHYLRATILFEQGALEEAKQALQRALYLDADFVPGYLALGNLARQQGQAAAAARHFHTARALLAARGRDEIVPESEGMTAGRLLEILNTQRGLDVRVGGRPNSGRPPKGTRARRRLGKAVR